MVEENLVIVVSYMRIVIEASVNIPCDTMVTKSLTVVGKILGCCVTEVIIALSTARKIVC